MARPVPVATRVRRASRGLLVALVGACLLGEAFPAPAAPAGPDASATPPSAVSPSSPAWDPAPWLEDLAQIRTAIDRDYPNRDWLTGEREVSLDRWFSRTAEAIRDGGSDAAARQALDRLMRRFNDGHVELHWPSPAPPAAPGADPGPSTAGPVAATTADFCAARGYAAGSFPPGTASALPGYRPLNAGGVFATGTVTTAEAAEAGATPAPAPTPTPTPTPTTVGIVRLGVFQPQGYPALCEQAVVATHTDPAGACDAACEDRLLGEVYARMTRELMTAVTHLRAAGAEVLLVDLSRNGGGTEWAEAAARIVSPGPLHSARLRVLRSPAWVAHYRELAATLRQQTRLASPTDCAQLLALARTSDTLADGLAPCAAGAPAAACPRLADAGFATGLVDALPSGGLDGRSWRQRVFETAQFPYRDGVWQGPVIVLVDDETWSAAEQFAALLRDNDAAVVMGTRTGGAGCGHLNDPEPIVLLHSRASLELPNCARFRRDGRNEVGGVIPEVPTGVRWNDGAAFAGQLTARHLPAAVRAARALRQGRAAAGPP